LTVVIDASVVVKWLLPDPGIEPDVDRAVLLLKDVRDGKVAVLQPPHWLAEAAAVINRLRPAVAGRAVELLYVMELPVAQELEVFRRAVALGEALSHHVFDTLYHAVALEHDATLISADEKYCRKAEPLGSLVRLESYGR
jgi:predicted nucleic acid-binding protein